MIPDRPPRRVHSLPKILLCLLLLACSTGAAAQDAGLCELQSECAPISRAKTWLDQQQQNFMCDTQTDVTTCVGSRVVRSDNNGICRDIGELETRVGACLSDWQAWFPTAFQSMFGRPPPSPSCSATIPDNIASFKSNYAEMLQPCAPM